MLKEAPERILVVGSGGREHALGWKLAQEGIQLCFAPGNGGTSELGVNVDIGIEEIDRLVSWAKDQGIDLIVVGPEAPLAAGLVDAAAEAKVAAFGPSLAAARLEADKAFAVEFMGRHKIPHPQSRIFTDIGEASNFLTDQPWPSLVIKAAGLAGGKGVILPESIGEAEQALQAIMVEKRFGEAGNAVVIQERLSGPEVSILAFTDGENVVPLLPTQDHKRLSDNNLGPNTGGMGAYGPVPMVTPELLEEIQTSILQPTVDGMREEGRPYRGVLYAGLMLTQDGPQVLEYNVRFGDPEAQPLMMLFASYLTPVFFACLESNLKPEQVSFRRGAAVCVVLASEGYPGSYSKKRPIFGLNRSWPEVAVFHAGTVVDNGQVITDGGRVLGITAYGKDIAEACRKAYAVIGKNEIHFDGMHYRTDIAYQAR